MCICVFVFVYLGVRHLGTLFLRSLFPFQKYITSWVFLTCWQILRHSAVDDLISKFDGISFQDEEDRGEISCRLCEKEVILVTQKFCASCLDNAISEATINISAKMNAKDKAKKTKKRKLSETFVLQATKVRRMNTFPLLPPEYKIPKQEIYNDDLDYKYIRALSTML